MKLKFVKATLLLAVAMVIGSEVSARTVLSMSKLGLKPNSNQNASVYVKKALDIIYENNISDVTIQFEKGKYNFYNEGAFVKELYISNHDQTNPKTVGIYAKGIDGFTIDGDGAELLFHGRMLPIALIECKSVTVNNISIDFPEPHMSQAVVIDNKGDKGIVYKMAPFSKYEIVDSTLVSKGDGWAKKNYTGLVFEPDTRRIVYNTSDINMGIEGVVELSPSVIYAPRWINPQLKKGHILVLRNWDRPTPGIFVSSCKSVYLNSIKVHYAEGMGLLAQMSEDITLKDFDVCLRDEKDPRYFTTQADATHFSGCKGVITSDNGLYENMMDDAINVHGTYLKVVKRVDARTLQARYMHPQAWGFKWGEEGNEVQFIASKTMEIVGAPNEIESINSVDKPTEHGARLFEIRFRYPLAAEISEAEACGIENLTWTPEVKFRNNIVRNNRARGALFSTPKHTDVLDNTFDHVSGSAILLCGDCNGWYETGACRNVMISGNKFINALTSMFQFTNAVISIYPEIPDLASQKKYFHGGSEAFSHKIGIIIAGNSFEVFDNPIVYAKSIDGLRFSNNKITTNNEYPAFHKIKHPIYIERGIDIEVEGNKFNGKQRNPEVVYNEKYIPR